MEIRTYEGDGQDVVRLIEKVWQSNYGGKTWAPSWSLETLRWQILAPRNAEARDCLLAVYEGTRLTGCFFADLCNFSVRGEPVRGSLMSWFTVDPDAGAPMVAVQLVREMSRRHAALDAAFSIGYVMGKPNTPARRFWGRYAELHPRELRFLRRVGYWVRVLDPSAVSRAGLTRIERWGAPWLRFWQPGWPLRPSAASIRAFQTRDLPDCLRLVNYANRGIDLGLTWSEDRLLRHLAASNVSETLVCETPAGVNGFLNYQRMTFHGREPLDCALIDLFAGSSTLAEASLLLRVALQRMRDAGLKAAVMLRTATCRAGPLLAGGFLPLPAQDHLVGLFPTSRPESLPTRRISVLLR